MNALAPAPSGRRPAAVLLIDDDPDLLAALTLHLEASGWEVLAAADGEEGLRAAEQGFAVAVVDMMLPRLSGFQVVHHLRARFGPQPAVVMVSEFDAPEHRAYAELVGVTHFLGKPFALDHLLDLIARSLPAGVG